VVDVAAGVVKVVVDVAAVKQPTYCTVKLMFQLLLIALRRYT